MRDLELYKYGLQIIPYEGSATMMRNGDYYAHYHDHDMTINSIRRHSHKDAEAYERYSRDVLRQCKIIKPLLKMTPPDLTSFKQKDLFGALEFAKHFAANARLILPLGEAPKDINGFNSDKLYFSGNLVAKIISKM